MGEGDQFSDQPAPPLKPNDEGYDEPFDIPLEEGYVLLSPGDAAWVEAFIDADHRYSVGKVASGEPRDEYGAVHLTQTFDHPAFADPDHRVNFIAAIQSSLSTHKARPYISLLQMAVKRGETEGKTRDQVITEFRLGDSIRKAEGNYKVEVHNAQVVWDFLNHPRIGELPELQSTDEAGQTYKQILLEKIDTYLAPSTEAGVRAPLPLELP